MSLKDEFEAIAHIPHELVAWVKSLIAKLEGEDNGSEVQANGPVTPVAAPAAEGSEAPHPVEEPPAQPPAAAA